MARRAARWLTFTCVLAVIMGLLAGTWTDPWLWTYVSVWSLFALAAAVGITDDLARERFHPPEAGADRRWLGIIRLIALAHLVIGGLDGGRWHLTPVADGLRILGLAGILTSCALILASMRANRFFSPVVRIQAERGHRVVASGPYASIRHPGYLGMVLAVPLSGLALDSWLSAAIGLLYSGLILRRVVFEDAFLRKNLDGYAEYAARVRYRLIPGAW